MNNETPYLQKDLIDHADLEDVEWLTAVDREDALKQALPPHAHVAFERSGGWQGDYAFVAVCGGHIWVETGYYGSCSGCDAFRAHKREEIERLLRDAYCFESYEDMCDWALNSEATEMSVGSARVQLNNALEELGMKESGGSV